MRSKRKKPTKAQINAERKMLVQEVIASWNEYITAYRESPNAYRVDSLRVAVLRRVEALAEWRP